MIAFVEDTLAFEDWLKGRLLESCGEAGNEFTAVIDGLQTDIDGASTAKTALYDAFFADFGADGETRQQYADAIDALFQAAVEDGSLVSSFDAGVTIPTAPESCSSITNPLF